MPAPYTPSQLNSAAFVNRCSKTPREFRVDYCNRLGSVRYNFAMNIPSYQEAVTMADGLLHDDVYSVTITRMGK